MTDRPDPEAHDVLEDDTKNDSNKHYHAAAHTSAPHALNFDETDDDDDDDDLPFLRSLKRGDSALPSSASKARGRHNERDLQPKRSHSDPASIRKHLFELMDAARKPTNESTAGAVVPTPPSPSPARQETTTTTSTTTRDTTGAVKMGTSNSAVSLRGAAGVTFAPNTHRTNHKNATWQHTTTNKQQEAGHFRRRYSSSAAVATSSNGSTPGTPTGLSSSTSTSISTNTKNRVRVYRSSLTDKLTTRDIAALDFLLGIPLEVEESIVQNGWMLQQIRRKTFRAHSGVTDYDDDDDDDDDERDHIMYDDENDYGRPQQQDDVAKREEINALLEPPGSAAAVATTAQLASHSHSHHGRWWEKWVPREGNNNPYMTRFNTNPSTSKHKDDGELELPTESTGMGGDMLHGTPGTDMTSTTGTTRTSAAAKANNNNNNNNGMPTAPIYAPGRRLEGDDAVLVQIPLKVDTVTRQKSIARQAAIREWEIKVAHGLMGGMDSRRNLATTTSRATAFGQSTTSQQSLPQQQALLDGRMFFSASGSYPLGVFSLKRYEPKREEAARRRLKLEARGGGGSHFVMPSRDWRGISFRALLPRKAQQTRSHKGFNRFLSGGITSADGTTGDNGKSPANKKRRQLLRDDSDLPNVEENNISNDEDDEDSDSEDTLSSSSSEDSYIPGILDDPEIKYGRHRNVMIGDAVTGCIVASTIQFVKPTLLKADLNQKFRDRFDGWEPNKSQRKYIGARVVDGVYTLIDPTESQQQQDHATGGVLEHVDKVLGDASEPSPSAATPAIIRMPPSLTLSKIRSVKRQALMAFVRADLEIGTIALACVYFERLCLSCRVDKTNRRLCFASCILMASKINEPNEVLVMKEDTAASESGDEEERNNTNIRKKFKRLESSIRPSKRSSTMFASLLTFFTQEWNLSLKHLFAAEWGVFAALRFSLHATPSQVAFHFKRLMKTLEWNPGDYLGSVMYEQWQDALAKEEQHNLAREKRRERRRLRKERRLHRELQKEVIRGKYNQMAEKDSMRKKSATKGKGTVFFEQTEKEGDSQQDENAVGKKSAAAQKKSNPSSNDDASDHAKRPGRSSYHTPPGITSSHSADEMTMGSSRAQPKRSSSAHRLLLAGMSRSPTPHGSPRKERLSFPGMMPTVPTSTTNAMSTARAGGGEAPPNTPIASGAPRGRKNRQMKLFTRLGMRRPVSSDKLSEMGSNSSRDNKREVSPSSALASSPSMPHIALAESERDHEEEQPNTPPSARASNTTNNGESVAIDIPNDGNDNDLAHGEDKCETDDDDDLGIVV
ncbi:Cyclin [Seminavis robusta]|uniref:Cyclin n=1 Tax=Seminavis robusta TaxID=568900 RepID=A0A9N8D837_9STRA|nr:Cyclin [Seminavis robusta]|eukprot:Sro35_g022500.1 Cyclin (1294) ;mRNA; r:110777-114750